MIRLSDFFILDQQQSPVLLSQDYNWQLVLISLFVAISSAWMALQVAGLARTAETRRHQDIAIFSGSMALGVGVWSMHFIGMMALDLCISVSYDKWITALSLAPGIAAAWVALKLLSKPSFSRLELFFSGSIMGAGIGLMHYLGMAAMRMSAMLRYDLTGFFLSLIIAVVLANLALWIRYGLQQHKAYSTVRSIALGGIVMGLAISGMHYTGMAAARFIGNAETVNAAASQDRTILALSIALITLIASLFVLGGNAVLRYFRLYQQIQENEVRLRAVVETAVDGIITIDSKGSILAANAATERLFGWPVAEILGRNISILMPEPYHSNHDNYLRNYLSGQNPKVIGQGREVMAKRRNGSVFPIRLAVGRANSEHEKLFVGFVTDLSDKLELQRELSDRERKYRTLIANIPGAAFRSKVDQDWTKLFVSDPILQITGWPATAFIEGEINISQLIHGNDLQRVRDTVAAAIRNKCPWSIEYRIFHRDGSERWVSESASAVYDDLGEAQWIDGVMLDETSRKLQAAEFASLVHAIRLAFAVVEFDMQGNILTANQKFLDLTGYTMAELAGKNHKSLCPPIEIDQTDYQKLWQNLRQGVPQTGEFHRWGKAQRDLWIQAAYNPVLDPDGKPWKVVKLAADVSLRKAIEVDLIKARDTAEQAATSKGMFLANMSHEIRTPMNAILGFTELLINTEVNPTQAHYLKTVRQSAISLLRLLNEILDTAKLERGALELDEQDFDLHELCNQVCDTFILQCQTKQIKLDLQIATDCPAFIHADELRIRQILLNLMGNAVKFTEQGEVKLSLRPHQQHLIFEVTDTGIGIAEDRLGQIFAPFTQADASMTRRFGGTGLGTTIAKQLVELMGGTISVSSQLGQGSCFKVMLPLRLASGMSIAKNRVLTIPPLKILIVDDVVENLELLELTLKNRGHHIVTANGGLMAVEQFEATNPDLILMDVQMPEVDGLEASRRIFQLAQQLQRPVPPIIALTASVLSRDRDEALAVGMLGFATKPIILSDLEKEIARVLNLQVHDDISVAKNAEISEITDDELISWTDALSRWPDRETYLRTARQFLNRDWRSEWSAVHDISALLQFAHRLRGGAANLGMLQLSGFAAELETLDHMPVQVTTLRRLSQLLTQTAEVLQAQTAMPTTALDSLQQKQSADQNFIDLLENLKEKYTQNQYDEASLEQIQAYLSAAELAKLNAALEMFDFDQALSLINQIKLYAINSLTQDKPV